MVPVVSVAPVAPCRGHSIGKEDHSKRPWLGVPMGNVPGFSIMYPTFGYIGYIGYIGYKLGTSWVQTRIKFEGIGRTHSKGR